MTEGVAIYGESINRRLLALIDRVQGSVLDLGCGVGRWARGLRGRGASYLVGVDESAQALEAADPYYDETVCKRIEDLGPDDFRGRRFELIVMADVLEHLSDPWTTLDRAHWWAMERCRLAVSVPNIRYYGILGRLLVARDFPYSDTGGVLDRGHLRWFTQRSLCRALRENGWWPMRWLYPESGPGVLLSRLSRGSQADMLLPQIMVIARSGRIEKNK